MRAPTLLFLSYVFVLTLDTQVTGKRFKGVAHGCQVWLQSVSDWPQMRQIRDFSAQISVTSQNVLKSELKQARIFHIWGQSDPLWSQTLDLWCSVLGLSVT